MTPERLAEIEQQHERNTGIGRDECLRRGCLTCLLSTALRAAWGERDALRDAITTFDGVLATDSNTVLSPRVAAALNTLVAVAPALRLRALRDADATGETPAAEEGHDG